MVFAHAVAHVFCSLELEADRRQLSLDLPNLQLTLSAPAPSRSTMSTRVPTIEPKSPSHAQLYDLLHRTLSRAKKVTIVCGAGLSTSAGIP
ncbi:hypothetical protein FRC12_003217, partial [Ceratobasidium sp. 428]